MELSINMSVNKHEVEILVSALEVYIEDLHQESLKAETSLKKAKLKDVSEKAENLLIELGSLI